MMPRSESRPLPDRTTWSWHMGRIRVIPIPQRLWPEWRAQLVSRPVAYILILLALALVTCFYQLGDGTLLGDEAAFAFTTERMATTGDWVVPYIGHAPHLNAAPLYNWLTLATASWFDDVPLRYRFWSAVFGVGCVLLTYSLGTLLFRCEVGFLAGLFLALNRDFLFCHGVRFGGMDALTTFFLTAAVICYVSLRRRTGRTWPWWSLLGVCIGFAWLSKPPIFGGFFLGVIGLHHLLVQRDEKLLARLRGPLLALVAGGAVASIWYVPICIRLGAHAPYELFIYNSVVRATEPTDKVYLCCHKSFWHSSTSFKLMETALVSGLLCWWLNYRRAPFGVLLTVAGSFLLSLTVAGKTLNYIFYAYPLLCVLLAAMLLEGGPWFSARCWRDPRAFRWATWFNRVLILVLLVADSAWIARILTTPAWVHPPVAVHTHLQPQLAHGACRLVLFDFHYPGRTTPTGSRLNFEDFYYNPRLHHATWVDSVEQLKPLLADGRPTVVICPPIISPTPAWKELCALGCQGQFQIGRWQELTYPVLTFHGAHHHFESDGELEILERGPR